LSLNLYDLSQVNDIFINLYGSEQFGDEQFSKKNRLFFLPQQSVKAQKIAKTVQWITFYGFFLVLLFSKITLKLLKYIVLP